MSKVQDENYFASEYDIPDWFRGISTFQMEAAEKLQNALRDDCEQGTTHRVLNCLHAIGLHPILEIKMLRRIMQMSQHSDLAFLYGLLTLYYAKVPKDKKDGKFSFNEQLLMSSICHLDMIPTLRELDRILPKGHAPLEVLAKKSLAEKEKQKYLNCLAKWKRQNTFNPKLPYFQKLALPVCKRKIDYSSRGYFVTTEHPYENYKDPLFIIPNAERWFASYKLSPSRRIANGIVYDEFYKIFEDYDAVHKKAEETDILCEKHLGEYMAEWRKREETKLNMKYKCLSAMKKPALEKKKRKQQLVERLEHDVEFYRHKLRKEHKEKYYNVTVVREDDRLEQLTIPVRRSEPYVRVIDADHPPYTPPSSAGDIPKYMLETKKYQKVSKSGCKCGKEQVTENFKPVHKCGGCYSKPSERLAGGADENVFGPWQNEKANNCVKHCKPPQTTQHCPKRQRVLRKQTELRQSSRNAAGHEKALRQQKEGVFFKAATAQVPYKFDYERVYRFDSLESTKHFLQEYFVKCLDKKGTVPTEQDGHPNVMGAVEKCFQEMVKSIWRKKRIEYEEAEKLAKAQIAKDIENIPQKLMAKKYPQKLFNPDDKQLMDNMLIDALKIMRKDPYFVLAIFPDVHKLPILRQWIYKRYGKRYTRTNKILFFNSSISFCNELISNRTRMTLPPHAVKVNEKLTYENLFQKKQEVEKFNYELKAELDRFVMRKSREFWFALRPYLLESGPPTNTYFAYTPPRKQDVYNYSVWNPKDTSNVRLQQADKER